MLKNDRWRDTIRDLPYIVKGNLIDLVPKILRNPQLLFSIPADLIRQIPRALAARRRSPPRTDFDARAWMRWSTELLRAEREGTSERPIGKRYWIVRDAMLSSPQPI
jgi:hypothetical protein